MKQILAISILFLIVGCSKEVIHPEESKIWKIRYELSTEYKGQLFVTFSYSDTSKHGTLLYGKPLPFTYEYQLPKTDSVYMLRIGIWGSGGELVRAKIIVDEQIVSEAYLTDYCGMSYWLRKK